MKLLVVYDDKGKIHALFKTVSNDGKPHLRVRPLAQQHVDELDVPQALEHLKLSAMHAKLRIDRTGSRPRLVSAE